MDIGSTKEVEFSFENGIVTFTKHEVDGQWNADVNRCAGSPARPMRLLPPSDASPTVQNAVTIYLKWLADYPEMQVLKAGDCAATAPADSGRVCAGDAITCSKELRSESQRLRDSFRQVLKVHRATRAVIKKATNVAR